MNPLLAVILLTLAPAPRGEQIELTPCTITGLASLARCGRMTVPERRDAESRRMLSLRIVVVEAPTRMHDDPIVFLAGGPGQGAAQMAASLVDQLQGIQQGRDVVLIDQRGTGDSSPLSCAGGFELLSRSRRDDLIACAAALRQRADLDAYGTDDAIADLEDVRAALGYEHINLVAGSYGTRPALEYMRRYTPRVRTALLRAVVPAGFNIIYDGSMNSDAALERVLDDCRADRACSTAAGDVHEHLESLRARIAAAPDGMTLSVPGGKSVSLTETLFMQTLYALSLSADSRQALPMLLRRAAIEGLVTLAPIAATIASQIYASVSFGMYMSVVCSEDAPRVGARQRARLASVPGSLGPQLLEACAAWRVSGARRPVIPVAVDTPTLILSGVLDPATPASAGDEAARHLPQSKHVVLPATAHGPLLPACGTAAIRRFIDAASAAAIDLGCAGDIKLKAFVPTSPK